MIPLDFGVIVAKANEDWVERVREATNTFKKVLCKTKAQHVTLEFQVLYRDSISLAAGFKGDLFKLSCLTGALTAVSWEATGRTPTLLKPAEWKGQLPKDIVEARIVKHYSKQGVVWPGIPNHAMDAVGMGFAVRGLL